MKAGRFIFAIFLFPLAAAAASRSASMTITALVQPSTTLTFSDNFQQFAVTGADISRGYVDVPSTVQFVLDAGTPLQRVIDVPVEITPDPDLVKAIEELPKNPATAAQTKSPNSGSKITPQQNASGLFPSYRLFLTGEAKKNAFSVPITITINL